MKYTIQCYDFQTYEYTNNFVEWLDNYSKMDMITFFEYNQFIFYFNF